MNNDKESQIEPQPTDEKLDTPQIPDQTEPQQIPAEEPQNSQLESESTIPKEQPKTHEETPQKKPPTRFQRFLRKALIILVIAAVIFLAGLLVDHFVRYQPLSNTLDETQVELEQANQTISELEVQNTQLTNANRTANNEIIALEAELASVKANALFYQVLVDVNTARIELFMEDIEGAQAALVNTQDNLEALLPYIIEVDPELGLSLPRRLDLIISGLARDPETGLIDLELFTKDLLELEPLLVGD